MVRAMLWEAGGLTRQDWMFGKNNSARIDLFVVTDAVLISLACMLIYMAYKEVNNAPVRHAQEMAATILAVSDDFSKTDTLSTLRIGNGTHFDLIDRLENARKQVGAIRPGSTVTLYSDHPDFKQISGQADPFAENALARAKSGQDQVFESVEQTGGRSAQRAIVPWHSPVNCRDCIARGVEDYKTGDIIGVREVVVPVGDEYARTISKLLYSCAVLAAALMCVLGVIFPMIKRNSKEREEMTEVAQSLEKQASTDPLTGLHNRRYFETALQDVLSEFNAQQAPLGLLVFDLDHFKLVNDTHGHDAGDIVLKEVALRLKAITRDSDIVARIGGEEFAVITPYASHEQLLMVAERYREMIGSLKVDIGKVILRPTISIGVATNSKGETEAADLFKAADKKLYEAKRNGRNRVAA
ncbi:MAG: GGDEF domain-containing protein [Nitratireductor sp.]|nr:GGDEF domain-containing protein [Nitratireductor sp.]